MKIKLKMTYNPTMRSNVNHFWCFLVFFFSMHLNQGSADFFREGLESILNFVRHRVSVSTTQLHGWNWKAADNKFLNGCGCVPITQK